MPTEDADLTVEQLIQRLSNPWDVIRWHAAALLGGMGEAALPAVPTLLNLLRAEQAQDRRMAAWTLGEIGPGAEVAVPALLDAVGDEDQVVCKMALRALEQIDFVPATEEAA